MEIYQQLPTDIKNKIFMYFEHPIVTLLNRENYDWVMNTLKCPPILSAEQRFKWVWILHNPLTHSRKRCGCYWYEQHLVVCEFMEEEELEGWDPAVEATPLMQAIDKETVMREIRESYNSI